VSIDVIQRLTHIGIGVTDLARSRRYYRDLLGFTEEHTLDVEGEPTDTLLRLRGTTLHAVYLTRDGVRIELLHFESPKAPPRHERVMNEPGLTHLSFRVADLQAVLAALRDAGERVLDDTVLDFPEFQAAAAFVADPDGQLIELVQAPGDPAAPPRSG
jgi:catechol 2,3-dioxygenase-like lactoylglutathione lyase family enzyme